MLLGTNYAYLNRAPAGPSLLDVMGPWPYYMLVEASVIAIAWLLLTLPFVAFTPRDGSVLLPGGLLWQRDLRRAVPPA